MRATLGAVLAVASWASAQNVVQLDLNRVALPGIRVGKPPLLAPLRRRGTFTQTAINNITGGGYYVDIAVGNPPQKMSMVLDTGSSDAWVVSHDAEFCTNEKLQQAAGQACGGTYNPGKSSSYKLLSEGGFSITYIDQSTAAGDYISDDFTIAGTTIKSLQMGLVSDVDRGTGVLGIGYNSSESTIHTYPNLVDQFVNQGLISSRAYSLWLNDRRSDAGTILFGGIDKEKFIGPLNIVPVLPSDDGTEDGTYATFAVAFSSLKVASNGTSGAVPFANNDPIAAVLDTGTTLSYIPDSMAAAIYSDLGVVMDNQVSGLALIDCTYLESDLTITFGFGLKASASASIAVPVYEMVLDIARDYQSELGSNKAVTFSSICVFGLQPMSRFSSGDDGDDFDDVLNSLALLGDTVLRSAYVVYDLDHNEIGLAQANLNSTASGPKDIVELNAAAAGIPSVTGVAAQQTTYRPPQPTRTAGDSSSRTGSAGGVETVTVTGKPKQNSAAGGLGGGPARGPGAEALGVMALAGVLAAVGGAVFAL
ncbi:aspartic peptidase domain-containing protein [Phialemonium atrogriseum]|uniref:Aspartic peptidase domain-containing protein n=1 Tax=Phialemonium atrogriseum TaxID=1093897 RepID=A0AAJ0BWV5_9PEZI|nr:aspartic peptidase domain-containing protein [Phialemonium atrogriseum]KAK1763551.1 aspartic peptidase domain-containing protein [Phialemonium atrogriseum]